MAITIKRDVLTPEAGMEYGVGPDILVRTMTRPGVITGLPTGLIGEEVLFAARDALQADLPVGTQNPFDTTFILRRYTIRPVANGVCTFTEIYENYAVTALGVWVVEDDTAVQAIERDWYWAEGNPGQPPYMKFIRPTSTGTSTVAAITNPQRTSSMLIPMRTLRLTGTVYGTSTSSNYGHYVGYVNNSAWQGRGPGGWLITRMRTVTDKIANSYTLQAEVTRAHVGDWRNCVRAISVTGEPVQCDQTRLDSATAQPYAPGVIHDGLSGFGFEMFGIYPMMNFNSLFGSTF